MRGELKGNWISLVLTVVESNGWARDGMPCFQASNGRSRLGIVLKSRWGTSPLPFGASYLQVAWGTPGKELKESIG